MLYYVNYYMYTTFILKNMYITFTLNNVNIQSEHLFCLAFCAYVSCAHMRARVHMCMFNYRN